MSSVLSSRTCDQVEARVADMANMSVAHGENRSGKLQPPGLPTVSQNYPTCIQN